MQRPQQVRIVYRTRPEPDTRGLQGDASSETTAGNARLTELRGDAFDLSTVAPHLAWQSANIDKGDDGEAEVPRNFELVDEPAGTQDAKAQKHISAPLPDFYQLDEVPTNLTTLPELEYYSLDPDVDPVRLLVLLPHFGNPFSTVECNLFPVSMKTHHYCFAAVANTRGNKHVTSHIVVNNCRRRVTRNLEVFLRHFRRERHAMVVWIREICIDVCDIEEHRTPIWRDAIMNKACKWLDMAEFMNMLQTKGILEKERQYTIRHKEWTKIARQAQPPTYYPIALRTFTNEQIKGSESDIPILPHEYLPLDMVAEEIRLIVLLPSELPDAPLVAHLAHESLYGNSAYQCLSYTWGEDDECETMILSGQSIQVRKNLVAALKRIRGTNPGDRITIWVDAICINQENTTERSRQVSRMHQVYELADIVLIWLGEAYDDSETALDFASEMLNSDTVFEPDGKLLIASEEMARKWSALYRLLLRPYFRRMWIVQELSLASVPTVMCGNTMVSWYTVHQASLGFQLYSSAIHNICASFGMPLEPEHLPRFRDGGCPNCFQSRLPDSDMKLPHKLNWHREMRRLDHRPSFLYLCLLNRDAECRDPRDKIYALWNLAREADQLGDFRPDYSLPVKDVYTAFTQAYIQATRSLDIICVPANYCRGGVEPLGQPSWVTDWRFRSAVNSYIRPDGIPLADVDSAEGLTAVDRPIYRASRGTKAIIKFNGESLTCAGVILDVIVHVSEQSRDPIRWIDEAKEHCHRDFEPIQAQELDRQLTSMLMGDATSSWESDDTGARMRWVGRMEDRDKSINKVAQVMPGNVIQSPFKARTFVVTSKGYMGLAPYWATPGLEVAVLLGCSVPVLLEQHGDHYHVKGDCFVQGWMQGEMLEGMGETDEAIMEDVAKNHPPIELQ